jgi:alkaline phosphatase D
MRFHSKLFLALLQFTLCSATILTAQSITHGPVIGGVTANSVRMYVRTTTVQSFAIELSTDSNFSNTLIFNNTTQANLDNSVITDLTNLQPNTKYYYRVKFNGVIDNRKGSFITFPVEGEAGNYVFVTGSCQETPNMKTFDVMPKYNPRMLIHSGDFTYPDYQIGAGYPTNYNKIEEAYRKRYEEPVMKDMLLNMPIAYMPDNHDNWGTAGVGVTRPRYTTDIDGKVVNFFEIDSATQDEKNNCLKGYQTLFPGYKVVDSTKAHYHSFKMGNTEFFMLDTRSLSDNYVQAYRYDTIDSLWIFDPPAGHSIIGNEQMNWLLNGLSNSTADWKFLVSGVPFNKKIKQIIDVGLTLQNLVLTIAGETGTGFRLGVSFSSYWAAYPEDIDTLLNHVKNNDIKGVLLVSGDTHHNVMDNGINAGLPEINASGLSVATTELAYQIAQYAPILGQPPITDSLWNAGGNGLFNQNFKNAFGKIEVFGSDSVSMCIIDEDDVTLSCMTIYKDGTVSNVEDLNPDKELLQESWIQKIYPNPNNGNMIVELDNNMEFSKLTSINIVSLSGKVINNAIVKPVNKNTFEVIVPNLSAGTYYVVAIAKQGKSAYRSFMVK